MSDEIKIKPILTEPTRDQKYLNGRGLSTFYGILNNKIENALNGFKLHPLNISDGAALDAISYDGSSTFDLKVTDGLKLVKLNVETDNPEEENTGLYKIGHSNSVIGGAGSATPSEGVLKPGDTFSIPVINYDTHGHITSISGVELELPSNYELPIATNTVLGGVKIGYPRSIKKGEYVNKGLVLDDTQKAYTQITSTDIADALGYVPMPEGDITIPEDVLNKVNKSLKYAGTVNSSGNLPANHTVGDVYVISEAGTYAGQPCEAGDVAICITTRTSAQNSDWRIINRNWNTENGSSELNWGAETTLGTIYNGANEKVLEIKAKMPQKPVVDEATISGILNVTNVDDIKAAQSSITSENGAKIFIISDSYGKLPSLNQAAVTVPNDCVKQLSIASPNSGLQKILLERIPSSLEIFEPFGLSVGDIIVLARVKVKVDDLCAYIKLSSALTTALKLALRMGSYMDSEGQIEVYQFKIWCTNDTRWENYQNEDGTIVETGAKGLLSVYDQGLIGQVPGLKEKVSNSMMFMSRWGTEARKCLENGVYPYVNREWVCREWNPETNQMDIITQELNLVNSGLWPDSGMPADSLINDDCWGTVVSKVSTTPDGGGYYTIEQTLYCRAGRFNGVDFHRFFFFQYFTEEEITAKQEAYNPENYGGMVFDEYMVLTCQAMRTADDRYINLASITGDYMWYPSNSSVCTTVGVTDNRIDDDLKDNINATLYDMGIIEDADDNIINDDGYIVPNVKNQAVLTLPRRYRGVIHNGTDLLVVNEIPLEGMDYSIIGSGSVATVRHDDHIIIHGKGTVDTALTEKEIRYAINQAIPGLV